MTYYQWVQHRYCYNAARSFSEHTYLSLFVRHSGSSVGSRALCAVQQNAVFTHMAVTTLLGQYQKLNRAVNRPSADRAVFRDGAVEIWVHYTAVFRSHY